MESSELKPCPFCGGEAVMVNAPAYDGGPEWFNVECCKCTVTVEGGYEEEDAIKAWNTRHPNIEAVVKRAVELAREIDPVPPSENYTVNTYEPDEILSIINKEFECK